MTLILKAFVIVLIVACVNAQQDAVNSAAEVIDDVEITPSAGDLSRDKRQLGGKYRWKSSISDNLLLIMIINIMNHF